MPKALAWVFLFVWVPACVYMRAFSLSVSLSPLRFFWKINSAEAQRHFDYDKVTFIFLDKQNTSRKGKKCCVALVPKLLKFFNFLGQKRAESLYSSFFQNKLHISGLCNNKCCQSWHKKGYCSKHHVLHITTATTTEFARLRPYEYLSL